MNPWTIVIVAAVALLYGFFLMKILIAQSKKTDVPNAPADIHATALREDCLYQGQIDGLSFQYQIIGPSRNSPAYLLFFIPFSGPEFKLSGLNKFDEFFQNLGYSRRLHTGEASFDRRFYCESSDLDSIDAFFKIEECRHAVIRMMERGFKSLEVSKGFLRLKKYDFSPKQPEFADLIKETFQTARILSDQAAKNQLQDPSAKKTPIAYLAKSLVYFSGACLIASVCALFQALSHWPLDGWDVFYYSLRYSLPFFLGFYLGAVFLLKGKANSHRVLLLVSALSLPAFLLGGSAYVLSENASQDTSPLQVHHQLIEQKYMNRRRTSTFYRAKVTSWRHGHDVEDLPISESEHQRTVSGETLMTIETKSGKLGFEWIVRHYVDDSEV